MVVKTRTRPGTDTVTPEVRSRIMKAVKQRGTGPELAVRALLSDLGVSYRVNNRKYPGSPDIVNRKRNWAIFVHGCFWHGHRSCVKTRGGRRGKKAKRNKKFYRH